MMSLINHAAFSQWTRDTNKGRYLKRNVMGNTGLDSAGSVSV